MPTFSSPIQMIFQTQNWKKKRSPWKNLFSRFRWSLINAMILSIIINYTYLSNWIFEITDWSANNAFYSKLYITRKKSILSDIDDPRKQIYIQGKVKTLNDTVAEFLCLFFFLFCHAPRIFSDISYLHFILINIYKEKLHIRILHFVRIQKWNLIEFKIRYKILGYPGWYFLIHMNWTFLFYIGCDCLNMKCLC